MSPNQHPILYDHSLSQNECGRSTFIDPRCCWRICWSWITTRKYSCWLYCLYFFSHLLIYVELNILMIMIGNQCLKLILKWVNMNKKNSIIAMVFMPEVYFSRKSNKNVIRRYQIYSFSTSYAYFNQTDDNDFLKFDLIILFYWFIMKKILT